MSFCPQCGNALPDAAAFCDKCGKRQTSQTQPQPVPHPTAQSAASPVSYPQSAPMMQPAPETGHTDFALVQKAAQMPASELLPFLYATETAVKTTAPYEKMKREAVEKKESTLALIDRAKAFSKGYRVATIILVVLFVGFLFLINSDPEFSLLGFLIVLLQAFSPPLIVISLGMIVVFLIVSIYNGSKAKKLLATLPALDADIANAQTQLNQIQNQYSNEFHFLRCVCPEECAQAEYMRMFISYFETARAYTLNEAKALFEQYIHREAMEMMAYEQVQHSIAAENAALEARSAAQDAAIKADQARTAANTAAWVSFWK